MLVRASVHGRPGPSRNFGQLLTDDTRPRTVRLFFLLKSLLTLKNDSKENGYPVSPSAPMIVSLHQSRYF
jgi:hypothetical protein